MKSERLAPVLIVVGLVSSLLASPQAVGTKTSPAPAVKEAKTLIRKDLLVFGKGPIVPPRRDIFRPGAYAGPDGLQGPQGIQPVPKRKATVGEHPAFALNIIYVGSVRSGGKTVALIVRDGQTDPVAEGDEISPGYKVLRITPDEIEIEGPNAERKTFSRQGDRP
jgi:hypothetical protein